MNAWWVLGLLLAVFVAIAFAIVYTLDYAAHKEQYKVLAQGLGDKRAKQFIYRISFIFGLVLLPFSIIYLVKRGLRK